MATALEAAPVGASGVPRPARWLLVGAPNVGKSALFGRLTGVYSTVSNYPGTSVEIVHGRAILAGVRADVVDTPGMHTLLAVTEEERVARRALLADADTTVIHIVDAAHLESSLPLTLQLIALGHPLVVACKLMDEARRRGTAPARCRAGGGAAGR